MDKKPNRSFYTTHFPEMSVMITEKLLENLNKHTYFTNKAIKISLNHL